MAIVRRERCLGVLVAWRRLAGKALALGAVELDIETEFADLELVQAYQHLLSVLFRANATVTHVLYELWTAEDSNDQLCIAQSQLLQPQSGSFRDDLDTLAVHRHLVRYHEPNNP